MGTHCQAAPLEGSRFSLLFKNIYFTMADSAETTTTVPEVPATEVEANGTTEATTNGDKAKETEATNGDAEKDVEAAKETKNGEEVTEGEAAKRKADTSDDAEEESAEKIAKLKEVAAEKLTEAEEKLPA